MSNESQNPLPNGIGLEELQNGAARGEAARAAGAALGEQLRRDLGDGYAYKLAQEIGGYSMRRGESAAPTPGAAQQARAPGKTFARSDILAIIRAELTRAMHHEAREALERMKSVFENLE